MSVIEHIRTPYTSCPICVSKNISVLTQFDCRQHPLWKPGLPFVINWSRCGSCGHVFTSGYFSGESAAFLFSDGQQNQKVKVDENARYIASLLIDRIATSREQFADSFPRWLDVGFGAGAILMTAAEYGYDVTGLELRQANVDAMIGLGYPARLRTIEQQADEPVYFEAYSVISMMDVLEHMPFPGPALNAARRLLKPSGALVISCPNMDTVIWRALDSHNANPYWTEIEHYHNFTRKGLGAILEAHGFIPMSYHVSPRYRTCCEIIAIKNGVA